MNAHYQHLTDLSESKLIHAFWVNSPKFGFHWHYHSELEITCVKQGRGTRLVGDNMNPFAAGDFVFMGSNLPHTWISDDDFNQSPDQMEVAVLQFHPDVFSTQLLHLSELANIRRLLSAADKGIAIHQDRSTKAADLLFQLIDADGFERFRLFLSLLDYLGQIPNFELLASNAYMPKLDHTTEERILNVCRYVHDHFMESIQLNTVAEIACMNPASFCRFFKKSTGESLFEYINDLRIGKACNLLMDKQNKSISYIAHQSGFTSQTLFNRIFMKKKGMTPTNFRKYMRE